MYVNDLKDLFGEDTSFVFVKEPDYSRQVSTAHLGPLR
jgi:hypothetical protein